MALEVDDRAIVSTRPQLEGDMAGIAERQSDCSVQASSLRFCPGTNRKSEPPLGLIELDANRHTAC